MRLMTIGMVATMAAAILGMDVSIAHAQSCFDLWVQRNSIYKRAGYCFKTTPAIRHFGNAGCMYDNEAELPLTPGERARIAGIVRMERRFGCSQ